MPIPSNHKRLLHNITIIIIIIIIIIMYIYIYVSKVDVE